MQGLGLDQDQTDIDSPWWSQSQSQNFCQGLDCLVSSLAKMAWDRTRPNFPNTSTMVLSLFYMYHVAAHWWGVDFSPYHM